ncbi:MAG: DUF58 domain-containing protein [Thermoplasmata archaeon]|nr:DUF58 domain-containing protein [Thermoplasmata archaeon]
MITRRGWEAVAATLVALVLALVTVNPLVALVAVAAFGFVATEMVVAAVRFLRLTPEQFHVERAAGSRRLPQDGQVEVAVAIRCSPTTGFQADVYDVVPTSFDVERGAASLATWVRPGDVIRLAYTICPRVRGAFVLGPTVIVAEDALGLVRHPIVLDRGRPLMIVPSSVMGRLGKLGVALFTRMQAGLSIRRRGFGTEFRALRGYQPSDDIRHVAWKRSTIDNIVVREFEQESRQDFLLVLDLSPPMEAGLWGRSALDASVEAAGLLASLIARGGEDQVGLLTYAGGVHQFLRPGRGNRHFRRLADNLALAEHRTGPCELPQLFLDTTRRLRIGTHLFVFSAANGSLERLPAAHANLRAHGHRPYLFLPDLALFYPGAPDRGATRAFAWAQDEERRGFHQKLLAARTQGIPTFTFDRRGASDRVIFAYTQIRGWGSAR